MPCPRSVGPVSPVFPHTDIDRAHAGMAIAPWNVLAGGKIRTDAEEEERRQSGENGAPTTTYGS